MMTTPIDSARAGALTIFAKEAYVFNAPAAAYFFNAAGYARALASARPDDILRVCYEIRVRRSTAGVTIPDPSPIALDPFGRPIGNVSDARIGDLYGAASTGTIASLQPQELYVLIAELNTQRALDPVVPATCPSCSYAFPMAVNTFTLGTAPH